MRRAVLEPIQQRLDRAARLATGLQLQHLAEENQHRDDRRRLKVEAKVARHIAKSCGKDAGATTAATL